MKTCCLVNGLGFSQEAAGIGSFGHLVQDLDSRKAQKRDCETITALQKTLEARLDHSVKLGRWPADTQIWETPELEEGGWMNRGVVNSAD